MSVSTRAYKLFSKGKTLVEVAIALNLTESEATNYYKEYWKLRHLYSLYNIHEEVKDDITSLVKLHNSIKAAGMDIEQVINLLEIADNDLPAVEQKYQKLMEIKKSKLDKLLQNQDSRIVTAREMLKSLRMSCQVEAAKIDQL